MGMMIEIVAGGNLAQARQMLAAAKAAGYTIAFLRKFELSATELAALGEEFANPLEVIAVPEFHQRESLHFARDVAAGETLTADAIVATPPLRGLTPAMLPKVLNRKALYHMKEGEPITFGVIDL